MHRRFGALLATVGLGAGSLFAFGGATLVTQVVTQTAAHADTCWNAVDIWDESANAALIADSTTSNVEPSSTTALSSTTAQWNVCQNATNTNEYSIQNVANSDYINQPTTAGSLIKANVGSQVYNYNVACENNIFYPTGTDVTTKLQEVNGFNQPTGWVWNMQSSTGHPLAAQDPTSYVYGDNLVISGMCGGDQTSTENCINDMYYGTGGSNSTGPFNHVDSSINNDLFFDNSAGSDSVKNSTSEFNFCQNSTSGLWTLIQTSNGNGEYVDSSGNVRSLASKPSGGLDDTWNIICGPGNGFEQNYPVNWATGQAPHPTHDYALSDIGLDTSTSEWNNGGSATYSSSNASGSSNGICH